jgi:hypothetical protein
VYPIAGVGGTSVGGLIPHKVRNIGVNWLHHLFVAPNDRREPS